VLLQCGASALQFDADHYTPLHLVARRPAGRRYTAEQLVACKQVIQLLMADTSSSTDAPTAFGETSLHLSYAYPELTEALIEAGSEVDATDNNDQTPLVST
jgi:ankyrin repeat protein